MDAFKWDQAQQLCQAFIAQLDAAPDAYPEDDAKKILSFCCGASGNSLS